MFFFKNKKTKMYSKRPLSNWWESCCSAVYDAIPMADSLATVLTNTEDISPAANLSSACSTGSWWSMCDWSQMGGVGPAFSIPLFLFLLLSFGVVCNYFFFYCQICVCLNREEICTPNKLALQKTKQK